MKKTKIFLLTITLALANFANALSIEVVPFNLEAGVEVMGVHVSASGKRAAQNAVILSGSAASQVAHATGIALNTTTHALLITGQEVTGLIANSLSGIHTGGRAVLIHSLVFADAALDLTLDAVSMGTYTVIAIAGGLSQTAVQLTRTLGNLAGESVVHVTEAGAVVLSTGAYVLGTTVNLITNLLTGILGGIFNF